MFSNAAVFPEETAAFVPLFSLFSWDELIFSMKLFIMRTARAAVRFWRSMAWDHGAQCFADAIARPGTVDA